MYLYYIIVDDNIFDRKPSADTWGQTADRKINKKGENDDADIW